MIKNNAWFWTKCWVGFVSILAIGFATSILIKEATANPSAVIPSPRPDDITVVSAGDSNNGQIVDDKTDDFYFSMPDGWYLEKSSGPGLAIDSPSSACKIEISSLAAAGDLQTWLLHYLKTDPTANISQSAIQPIEIMGAADALEWRGRMNGATTTLVYTQAGRGESAGNILEIAPSTLSQASDADNNSCDSALAIFLAKLTFGTYEKQGQ